MAVVATSTSMVGLMMILILVLAGNKTTQTFMTTLYTICLIGLFLTVVLVWKARYQVNTNYAAQHNHFTTAATNNCITNAKWNSVLTQWNAHTSFVTMASALQYLLFVFVGLLLVGVVFAIWALMNLAEGSNPRRA